MSFGLFAIILYVIVVALFLVTIYFFVDGGFRNYIVVIYFILAGVVIATWLVNLLTVSEVTTYQYDLNNYFLIIEIKNENKEYYYELVFDSNNQTEKVEAEKIIWIFSQHDHDLYFDNIIEYKETNYRVVGTNVELTKNEKEYEKFMLFVQKTKEITYIQK